MKAGIQFHNPKLGVDVRISPTEGRMVKIRFRVPALDTWVYCYFEVTPECRTLLLRAVARGEGGVPPRLKEAIIDALPPSVHKIACMALWCKPPADLK